MSIDLSKLITAEDKLEKAKASKVDQLSASCEREIMQGFLCEALGEPHHYPMKEKDQLNLASSVTDSLMPDLPTDWSTPFWCADMGGVWAMREHTAEQIQQAGREAKVRILQLMKRNVELAELAMGASNFEELESLVWTEANTEDDDAPEAQE